MQRHDVNERDRIGAPNSALGAFLIPRPEPEAVQGILWDAHKAELGAPMSAIEVVNGRRKGGRQWSNVAASARLKQPHSLVMLLVPWKRLIFGPPFLFQISNYMRTRRRGSLVAPKFANLLNAGKVM